MDPHLQQSLGDEWQGLRNGHGRGQQRKRHCHRKVNANLDADVPEFATVKSSGDGTELWVNRGGGYEPKAIALDASGNVFVTGCSSARQPLLGLLYSRLLQRGIAVVDPNL